MRKSIDSGFRVYWSLLQIMQRTSKADYIIPSKPKVSPECKDFLMRCLQPDPAKRMTVSQIYDHPWFAHDFPTQASTLQSVSEWN